MDALADQFNNGLAELLDSLAAALDVTFFRFDAAGLFRSLRASPEAFGLSNVTDPAYDESTGHLAPNPQEYLFWDELHPTAAAHELLGAAAFSVVAAPAAPGDANEDGVVNVLDLDVLGRNYGGTNAAWGDGDFNRDRIVNLLDLSILGAYYGQTGGGAVPEPATLSLLALGAWLTLFPSSRRRGSAMLWLGRGRRWR